MGNCICGQPQEKITVVVFNGGVVEFSASTKTAEEITSGPYASYKLVHNDNPFTPLPPSSKLEPGEVYHLVPHLVWRNKALDPSKLAHQEQESGKRGLHVFQIKNKYISDHCRGYTVVGAKGVYMFFSD